jgi:pimeloyl-ACP methyl ester carboxylesterase
MQRRRTATVAATVLAGAAALAGMGVARADAGSEPGATAFHRQQVRWQSCAEDGVPLDCARVTVPVDWARPDGATTSLAVVRHRATGERKGTFFFNPGGPGEPGTESVGGASRAFGTDATASFDVVSWDPRGVGKSSALHCPEAADDAFGAVDSSPDTATERRTLEAAAVRWTSACRAASGPLFDHVDTVSNARDLDVLRAVVGDRKLTYAGFSYGSRIGLRYAELFPARVGRVVLDGPVDATSDNRELLRDGAMAAERGLDDYLAGCADRAGCPLRDRTPDDARSWLRGVIRAADTRPVPASDGRAAGQEAVVNGVAGRLPEPRAWPELDTVLAGLQRGDATALLADGEEVVDVVYPAINCTDLVDRRTGRRVMADAARLRHLVFGHEMMSGALCPQWPVAPTVRPHPVTARGAAPILVVGTTRDAATPYEWAVSTARQLSSGHLLTRRAGGHVAYTRSACVTAAVDRYLVTGALPTAGHVCTD